MQRISLIKIWKTFLPFIFVFILVHFLKDLTQDILKVSTPLDLLGDAREDLSFLPKPFQNVYLYGLGGLSIIAEVFLLMAIPKIWKNKESTKLDKWVLVSVIFLVVFFIIATLLDPRFNPWFKIFFGKAPAKWKNSKVYRGDRFVAPRRWCWPRWC